MLETTARTVASVGVIGLGTMGAGIVEVVARTGLDVVAVEVDDTAVERGRESLEHSTARAVARGS
jgi:3-hydroxybutyryl-CoA dehydrogenase